MATSLECVGLGVTTEEELNALLEVAWPAAEPIAERGSKKVSRWTDPSGARLTFTRTDGLLDSFIPSFNAPKGAWLRNLERVNDAVVQGEVISKDGELLTRISAEYENLALLSTGEVQQWSGQASIVAFGADVENFASQQAYLSSPRSVLADNRRNSSSDPLVLGPQSFVSYDIFRGVENADAYARISGTVLGSSRHNVAATGKSFLATRVWTDGFEITVCTPAQADTKPFEEGSILAGKVYLIVVIEDPALLG